MSPDLPLCPDCNEPLRDRPHDGVVHLDCTLHCSACGKPGTDSDRLGWIGPKSWAHESHGIEAVRS